MVLKSLGMYTDDLAFRIEYEEKLKTRGAKLAIIAQSDQYIPYDVRRRLTTYKVTLENLFPKLNPELLKDKGLADLDLLCAVYRTTFDDFRQKRDTEMYLRMNVYSRANVKAYLKQRFDIWSIKLVLSRRIVTGLPWQKKKRNWM